MLRHDDDEGPQAQDFTVTVSRRKATRWEWASWAPKIYRYSNDERWYVPGHRIETSHPVAYDFEISLNRADYTSYGHGYMTLTGALAGVRAKLTEKRMLRADVGFTHKLVESVAQKNAGELVDELLQIDRNVLRDVLLELEATHLKELQERLWWAKARAPKARDDGA